MLGKRFVHDCCGRRCSGTGDGGTRTSDGALRVLLALIDCRRAYSWTKIVSFPRTLMITIIGIARIIGRTRRLKISKRYHTLSILGVPILPSKCRCMNRVEQKYGDHARPCTFRARTRVGLSVSLAGQSMISIDSGPFIHLYIRQ